VTLDEVRYNTLPAKFEAGTPDIAGVVGLAAAIEYLNGLDLAAAAAHESELARYTEQRLSRFDDVKLVGRAAARAGIVSFVMATAHPHDIGTVLDREGVAIRTGHHCCQPLMHRLGVPATARASLAFYNTRDDVDRFVDAIGRVREMFG
jgi:cysteine desulfurase / selenocysteine lyase